MVGEPVRVVVADDDADTRLLLRLQLSRLPGFLVVGEARDGQEALEVCEATNPDAIVLDLLMPVMTGIEAMPELLARYPRLAIVACSAVAGRMVRDLTARLGVPLVLKSGHIEPIVEAVLAEVARRR